ncbi:alpha/beta fold hydrolase [Deminuibacter soli]|nr:alpha/beta hydrolase [Deminuibacter soli]
MQQVYFLSGLGADERVFRFLDMPFCKPVYVPWIIPLPHEKLESYAQRLRQTIPEAHPLLAGVSFGGMLAVEMAKADPQIKAVIISSAKTRQELPRWMHAARYFPVYNCIPDAWLRAMAQRCNWLFGAEKQESIHAFHSIIRDCFVPFNTWAFGAILRWKNTIIPGNLLHIHGTADKMLPYARVQCNVTIPGGKHLMVMDCAASITPHLQSFLQLPSNDRH